ncbi:hypothetical protein PHLGIDRAFT_122635 [Phlebiopsis gigantea 11061_1 CR5-6]|uniref:Uncharacterized protein n=1 Tax=Phlebiopsis gigantea (strain 11061_1 CR5-6) TaxID=745531 RepID=A0A0C3RQS4_PHLG1|nr:hypothetical protein PHLGIDRAFT_122635 [Phlebiopsis gigantea 11061_1 CR5-6]
MDDEILKHVIKPCIEDSDTEPSAAVNCLLDIYTRRADGTAGVITQLHLIVSVLRRGYKIVDHDRVMKMLRILDRLCRAVPFKVDHRDTKELYEQVYELASQLVSFDQIRRDAFNLLLTLLPRANASVRVSATTVKNILEFANSSKDSDDYELYLN